MRLASENKAERNRRFMEKWGVIERIIDAVVKRFPEREARVKTKIDACDAPKVSTRTPEGKTDDAVSPLASHPPSAAN